VQRSLVSVRGPNEAVEAAKGGAHIADVVFPASDRLHSIGKVWIAGSVIREQMAPLRATAADVIWIRGAPSLTLERAARFGDVCADIVHSWSLRSYRL
jgi:uncharacterized protein (UPF0264 family)